MSERGEKEREEERRNEGERERTESGGRDVEREREEGYRVDRAMGGCASGGYVLPELNSTRGRERETET